MMKVKSSGQATHRQHIRLRITQFEPRSRFGARVSGGFLRNSRFAESQTGDSVRDVCQLGLAVVTPELGDCKRSRSYLRLKRVRENGCDMLRTIVREQQSLLAKAAPYKCKALA